MRQLLLSPKLISKGVEADLERAKANELELQDKSGETEASLKKVKDGVSLLEKEVAD